jgi:hypothetical protein
VLPSDHAHSEGIIEQALFALDEVIGAAEVNPVTEPDLASYDVVLVNTSAGKDSQAALDVTVAAAADAGVLERVVAVHSATQPHDNDSRLRSEASFRRHHVHATPALCRARDHAGCKRPSITEAAHSAPPAAQSKIGEKRCFSLVQRGNSGSLGASRFGVGASGRRAGVEGGRRWRMALE